MEGTEERKEGNNYGQNKYSKTGRREGSKERGDSEKRGEGD